VGNFSERDQLVQTGGFSGAAMGSDHWYVRERRAEKTPSWRLDWAPGRRRGHHGTRAYWVLAEVIERVSSSRKPTVEQRQTRLGAN
jgi:hypothetical protein